MFETNKAASIAMHEAAHLLGNTRAPLVWQCQPSLADAGESLLGSLANQRQLAGAA